MVANAVKDLAGQVETSSKAIIGAIATLDERVDRFSRELRSDAVDGGHAKQQQRQSAIHQAFADVEGDVQRIARSADESGQTMLALNERSADSPTPRPNARIGS